MNNEWDYSTILHKVFNKTENKDLNARYTLCAHVWMIIGLSVNLKMSLCKCVAQS